MGWQIGFDSKWNRDIGYGVPATCDFPGCGEDIDRGLSFVCGGEPYGGELGCGLFFCAGHLLMPYGTDRRSRQMCERCALDEAPYDPTPDTPEWVEWKLTDESWATWRVENPETVKAMRSSLLAAKED